MDKKEKLIMLFGLSYLANEIGIKDNELHSKEQIDKFSKEIDTIEEIFASQEELRCYVIGLFRKYVNNL